jgi:hypothetical protein
MLKPMTVAELIDHLSAYPYSMPVFVTGSDRENKDSFPRPLRSLSAMVPIFVSIDEMDWNNVIHFDPAARRRDRHKASILVLSSD